MTDELCPKPLLKSDAAALIGIVARLQGEALAEQLDQHLLMALASRLQRDGVAATADARGLESALAGLSDRLREALDE